MVVNHTLKAMQLGSQTASQFFPRLLQLVEEFPESMEVFKKRVSSKLHRNTEHSVHTNFGPGFVHAMNCCLHVLDAQIPSVAVIIS